MSNNHFTIALAGNANVGKSVIFNQLTGLHQHIGNWPGKTVEKAEGTLHFKGYTIDFIDLARNLFFVNVLHRRTGFTGVYCNRKT